MYNDKPTQALADLIRFGGFPEPFLKKNDTFSRRWRRIHTDTIIREDLLDPERGRDIYDTGAVEGSFSARLENTVACALQVSWIFEVSPSNADCV